MNNSISEFLNNPVNELPNLQQDVKKAGLSVLGINIFQKQNAVKKIDKLSASIAKCDEIIDVFDKHYFDESSSANTFDIRSRYKNLDKFKLLHAIMKQDEVLSNYLEACNNETYLAYALAKADIKELEKLKEKGWISYTQFLRKIAKTFVLPIFLVLLMGVAADFIGTRLQEASFQRKSIFELRLDIIKEGQAKAVDILEDIRVIYRQVGSDEEALKNNLSRTIGNPNIYEQAKFQHINYSWDTDLSEIRKIELRLKELREFGKIISTNDVISNSVNLATKQLSNFFVCLEMKGMNDCYLKNDELISNFEGVVSSYSEATLDLLRRTEK